MAKPIAQLEPRPVIKYGVAVLAVAASVIGSLLLQASLDITPVVSLMLCGVMFAAWFGGLGPGLLAVALSLLAFDYFFVPPLYSFGLRYNDALRVGLFALAALFIVALSTKQRSAAQSLRRMHDDLQTALSELERVNASLQTENADRRRAEAELRRSERALQTIIDTIPAYVARFRPDGVPDFMNQTLHNFFGASVRLEEMRRTMHPDDLPQNLREWNAHIASGEPYENEVRLRRADGVYRWHRVRRVALRDENGKIVNWYGAGHDIDDQKQAEEALRRAQSELAHASRVATLGELSASIAHDVNQPLSAIITNAQACLGFLRSSSPDLDEVRDAIEWIVKDGNRAGEVIRRIRELSRKAEPEVSQIDINGLVEETAALVRGEAFGHKVVVQPELASGLPRIRGDKIQLQQVLINLVMNGIQAMASVADRARVLILRTQRHGDDQILVAVEDVGVGIEPENLGRLFNAFYTTKASGLGIGLSISRSIVEAHGGRVWAAPNAGPGMTFQFTLSADLGKTAAASPD